MVVIVGPPKQMMTKHGKNKLIETRWGKKGSVATWRRVNQGDLRMVATDLEKQDRTNKNHNVGRGTDCS